MIRKPPRRRLLPRLAPAVLVALILSAPLAYVLAPHLKRWTYLHWLTRKTSPIATVPDFVAAHAGEDGRVRRHDRSA
ncbi:MAG: hypothetical protein R3C45_08790 [Phycisphaerales bacterium]